MEILKYAPMAIVLAFAIVSLALVIISDNNKKKHATE